MTTAAGHPTKGGYWCPTCHRILFRLASDGAIWCKGRSRTAQHPAMEMQFEELAV